MTRGGNKRKTKQSMLSKLRTGSISEAEYFSFVNKTLYDGRLRCAQVFDQIRYVKFDPESSWTHEKQHAKTSVTPAYKKRRTTRTVEQDFSVKDVGENEFQELCVAFRNLQCPWCELKAGRSRSLEARASSRSQPQTNSRRVAVQPQFVAANLCTKQGRRVRVPYERRLFKQRLSLDEESEVAAMAAEWEKLQARVAEFSASLPEVCGVLPQSMTSELPRAATASIVPLATSSRCADRRFARKFSMRGRARWNARANLDCDRHGAEVLESISRLKNVHSTARRRCIFQKLP